MQILQWRRAGSCLTSDRPSFVNCMSCVNNERNTENRKLGPKKIDENYGKVRIIFHVKFLELGSYLCKILLKFTKNK